MSSKHFINSGESIVVDSLSGLCSSNPRLALDRANKIVHIANPDRSHVALICGGGSGHEPAHAGFVGSGLLTAAVCGNIFASPNPKQVRRAIDVVSNDKGTLIIVKNYTGDILNFGLAKEQYAALHPNLAQSLRFVIVADDVAVGKTQGAIVGRRGLAGTVFVYKIAGALARRGASLDDVHQTAEWVASRLGTIGVGLEHCHIPGTSSPKLDPQANAGLEIGMGIHNESGHKRLSPVPPLPELMQQLLDLLTSTADPERSFLPFQGSGADEIVLLVNNLGGLSELELGAVVVETLKSLEGRNIKVARILSGAFMTSLNMPGFSLTALLLPADDETKKSHILSLLDEPADASGWKWSSNAFPTWSIPSSSTDSAPTIRKQSSTLKATDPGLFISNLKNACEALIRAEPEITQMDVIAGDGDCGTTLKSGAEAVLQRIKDGHVSGEDPVGSLIQIAGVAEEVMGGTSGGIYSIFFSGLAQSLQTQSSSTLTPSIWAKSLSEALGRLYTYTRARPPSRTLIDPLAAFIQAFDTDKTFSKAVAQASAAAEATKDVKAKAGRSAYVDEELLKGQKVCDPGAWGVKVVLESLQL